MLAPQDYEPRPIQVVTALISLAAGIIAVLVSPIPDGMATTLMFGCSMLALYATALPLRTTVPIVTSAGAGLAMIGVSAFFLKAYGVF